MKKIKIILGKSIGWYQDRFVARRREYRAETKQSIFNPSGVQYPDATYTDLNEYITSLTK